MLRLATTKRRELLTRPLTMTLTRPVMAPSGTGTVMEVALQLVGLEAGEPCKPEKSTRLLPCVSPKFAPMTVTGAPTGATPGETEETVGAGVGTVKLTLFVAMELTVTVSGPVEAPAGTEVTMLELDQEVAEAEMPLKVMVLLPWVASKPEPEMVTLVPDDAE